MDLVFEWDEDKAASNLSKHGISFETARYVFLDENRIEIYDEENSVAGEDRYDVLGLVEDVLFVVYTIRGEHTRIISARMATRLERRLYYDSLQ